MVDCTNNNTSATTPANCPLLKLATTTTTTMTTVEGYSTVKIIFITILVIAMVVSNSLIVNAFLTSRRLQKKPSNFLITSQAASDLFTCLVFFPVHVVERYHRQIHVEGNFVTLRMRPYVFLHGESIGYFMDSLLLGFFDILDIIGVERKCFEPL